MLSEFEGDHNNSESVFIIKKYAYSQNFKPDGGPYTIIQMKFYTK